MNTLAYLLYLLISFYITVWAGLLFYRNGRVYILSLLQGDITTTDAINKILLVGYYLLNLGYVAMMIRFWKTINTAEELIASIAHMTSTILLSLAIVHFCNMAVIYIISKRSKQHSFNHTN